MGRGVNATQIRKKLPEGRHCLQLSHEPPHDMLPWAPTKSVEKDRQFEKKKTIKCLREMTLKITKKTKRKKKEEPQKSKHKQNYCKWRPKPCSLSSLLRFHSFSFNPFSLSLPLPLPLSILSTLSCVPVYFPDGVSESYTFQNMLTPHNISHNNLSKQNSTIPDCQNNNNNNYYS